VRKFVKSCYLCCPTPA